MLTNNKPFIQTPAAFQRAPAPKYSHDGKGTYTVVENRPAIPPALRNSLSLAFEFGFKCAEKGMNLEMAMAAFNEAYK